MEPDVIAWPGSRHAESPPRPAARTPRAASSGDVLAGLFSQHYVALVRLTVVLLRDLTAAEEVVQDAFVAIHRQRLRDPDKALAYLRRAVVNGSRSVLRRRVVAEHLPQPPPGLETSAVAAALAMLPRRQCEAVILRYYADLSETETAAAMGISESTVRSYAYRGMAALRQRLDDIQAQSTRFAETDCEFSHKASPRKRHGPLDEQQGMLAGSRTGCRRRRRRGR